MSRGVLEGENPHTYLEDLESFYFVLCWILMVYSGPHKAKTIPPKQAAWWDLPDSSTLKRGHIGAPRFQLPLEPWFGPCFQTLASRLFGFFQIRRPIFGDLAPPVDPKLDYDEYLGYVQQCILDMDAEELAAKDRSPSGELDCSDLSSDYRAGTRSREYATDLDTPKQHRSSHKTR
jgi:Fungal protein kinase